MNHDYIGSFWQCQMSQKAINIKKGQLVYLFAPSAVSLQTNTMKCHADFVEPIVINRVLDETHYISQ